MNTKTQFSLTVLDIRGEPFLVLDAMPMQMPPGMMPPGMMPPGMPGQKPGAEPSAAKKGERP